MSKIAIVYWSGTGNTEAMAELVAKSVEASGRNADMIAADKFDKNLVGEYDAIAFGCPSMGDETLEEDVFEPMFSDIEGSLSGKKVGLFGSYGWGDGLWMREWEDRCRNASVDLVSPGVIANEYPDAEAAGKCTELGKALSV